MKSSRVRDVGRGERRGQPSRQGNRGQAGIWQAEVGDDQAGRCGGGYSQEPRRGGLAGSPSCGYHIGYTRCASCCAALGLTDRATCDGGGVTAADLLVLAPWLIFGAALAAICYRLLARRRASRRHHRDGR
jgi:hypothetical protein